MTIWHIISPTCTWTCLTEEHANAELAARGPEAFLVTSELTPEQFEQVKTWHLADADAWDEKGW